jgi:hypothetical protein
MEICKNCLRVFDLKEYQHPLKICSLVCLKELRTKNNIEFQKFNFSMRLQKGSGKWHGQWIAKRPK